MLRWLAAATLFAGAATACGSGGGLPDQGACPDPLPDFLDDSTRGAYLVAVERGLDALNGVDDAFRAAWPERRIRERAQFREDFAAYAHLTQCTTDVLQALESPEDTVLTVEMNLEDITLRLETTLADGVEAVRTRNQTAYERWTQEMDVLDRQVLEFRAAVDTVQRQLGEQQ